jgi:hypothetical protein
MRHTQEQIEFYSTMLTQRNMWVQGEKINKKRLLTSIEDMLKRLPDPIPVEGFPDHFEKSWVKTFLLQFKDDLIKNKKPKKVIRDRLLFQ